MSAVRIPAVLAVVVVLIGVAASASSANNVEGGNPHWGRGSAPIATTYVEDFTGGGWPVYASQGVWNQSCCVNALYASGGSCPYNCVPAREGYYGTGSKTNIATTYYSYDTYGHFIPGTVHIDYNDSFSLSYAQRRSVTCQEQGHALGLDHRAELSSCMHSNPYDNPSQTPDGHDFSMLQYNIYNH